MGTLLDYLKKQGAPADVLLEAEEKEKGFLRQEDYTRKMQELSSQREQVSFLAGKMQQLQGAGPDSGAAQSAIQRYLSELGDDESGTTLRGVLGPALEAVVQEIQGTQGKEVHQLKRALVVMHKQTQLDEAFEKDLVGKYGPEVRKVFGDLKAKATQELLAERSVNPEQLLWELDGSLARDLISKQGSAARDRDVQDTTEGFQRGRRTTPPMDGADVVAERAPEEDAIPASGGIVDWEQYFAELRDEVPALPE